MADLTRSAMIFRRRNARDAAHAVSLSEASARSHVIAVDAGSGPAGRRGRRLTEMSVTAALSLIAACRDASASEALRRLRRGAVMLT